jgi:hypothetical protein
MKRVEFGDKNTETIKYTKAKAKSQIRDKTRRELEKFATRNYVVIGKRYKKYPIYEIKEGLTFEEGYLSVMKKRRPKSFDYTIEVKDEKTIVGIKTVCGWCEEGYYFKEYNLFNIGYKTLDERPQLQLFQMVPIKKKLSKQTVRRRTINAVKRNYAIKSEKEYQEKLARAMLDESALQAF